MPAIWGTTCGATVTAVNTYGQASATSAAVGPVLANAPINSAVPTVTGSPQRTDTLTATAGAWTGAGNTITYQWQRSADGTNWTNITSATAPVYNLALADEGDTVRVVVTATNISGVSSTPSAPTSAIAPYPPANTVAPAISGVAERGVTLNATEGTWTGPDNVYTYQWQRDAGEGYVDIEGATAASYTLDIPDEGATVRVVVTAADPDASISQASAPTATVTDALPLNQSAPTVTGTAQRGATLTAAAGTWAGIGNAYLYQWERSSGGRWVYIVGATASTYTLAAADEGDPVRVLVSASNPDGTSSAPSAATAAVAGAPPVATVVPTVSGSAQRGASLSASRGSWSGAGNAYAYQWQRSLDGTTWTAISGATGLSYTVAVADEGDYLRLSVTTTNPDATVTAASLPDRPRGGGAADRLHGASGRRHPGAQQQSHGHRRRVGWDRQRVHLPVAAFGRSRHDVDEHHRGDGLDLRGGGRRRGRPVAGVDHRHQCRRHGGGAVGRHHRRGRLSAAEHDHPHDLRGQPPRRHAHHHPGCLVGAGQRLLRPVAAIGRRHDVDEHHRGHRIELHPHHRGRG